GACVAGAASVECARPPLDGERQVSTGSRDSRESRTLGIYLGDRGQGRDPNATPSVRSGVINRDGSQHLRNVRAASVVAEGLTDRRTLENCYAAGFKARPALLVRGSSRRIMTMRCRPANIRVINRRDGVSATT